MKIREAIRICRQTIFPLNSSSQEIGLTAKVRLSPTGSTETKSMFFSNKEFFSFLQANRRTAYYVKHRALRGNYSGDGGDLTYKEASAILRSVKQRIASRQLILDDYEDGENLYKWYRPWTVVPALANFSAPEGDFGVGVEVEMGFTSRAAARQVANHIKDWKYVAIDEEGGAYPLEVTFPPICYSKLSNKSQVLRYLKYLNTVSELVVDHTPYRWRGRYTR